MKIRLRAEHVYTTVDLQDWCRRLHREGPHPCDVVRRFAIGVYQIYQAFDWVGTESESESWAAAAVHFIAAAEALNIPIEQHFATSRYGYITDIPLGVGNIKSLLYCLSKSQAQVVYATNPSRIKRKSRFDRGIASSSFFYLVTACIGMIPVDKRKNAFYTAMEIMTGEL